MRPGKRHRLANIIEEAIMSRLMLGWSLIACLLAFGCAGRSAGDSNLTVRTTGDVLVYGVYTSHMR